MMEGESGEQVEDELECDVISRVIYETDGVRQEVDSLSV